MTGTLDSGGTQTREEQDIDKLAQSKHNMGAFSGDFANSARANNDGCLLAAISCLAETLDNCACASPRSNCADQLITIHDTVNNIT